MATGDVYGDLNYELHDMRDWSGVDADIAICDPPFGLNFDGKAGNYNRDESRVVDGYVEWDVDQYDDRIEQLFDCLAANTVDDGQAIVFSGMDNSHRLHQAALDHDTWRLEGKLYWTYNFAPYCKKRPAHNVYELFWLVKGDDWYYTNECSFDHCEEGEANLSVLDVKRNYLKEMPKYPTRLPVKVVGILLEHFTQPGDTVFDPLAGSGSVGIAASSLGRDAVLGDLNENAKDVFESTVDSLADAGDVFSEEQAESTSLSEFSS
ncbi:DNA-methyltransferase [Halobacterium litoreum]|uniref:DNA-methyltransferase n=1 Tax=Halobacterium litoreum TaxID=2039234 RepID=A0ABD5NCT5_9EURY|nr:site-specific DNA-methyltransferase [Halobacterium litoreum]UHH14032.1 site-specific DNA-methyltransferase [Halobacterium litoreum]